MVQHLFWPDTGSVLVVHTSKVQVSVSSSICVRKVHNSMWRSQRASIGVSDCSGQLVVEHVLSILAEPGPLS